MRHARIASLHRRAKESPSYAGITVIRARAGGGGVGGGSLACTGVRVQVVGHLRSAWRAGRFEAPLVLPADDDELDLVAAGGGADDDDLDDADAAARSAAAAADHQSKQQQRQQQQRQRMRDAQYEHLTSEEPIGMNQARWD